MSKAVFPTHVAQPHVHEYRVLDDRPLITVRCFVVKDYMPSAGMRSRDVVAAACVFARYYGRLDRTCIIYFANVSPCTCKAVSNC